MRSVFHNGIVEKSFCSAAFKELISQIIAEVSRVGHVHTYKSAISHAFSVDWVQELTIWNILKHILSKEIVISWVRNAKPIVIRVIVSKIGKQLLKVEPTALIASLSSWLVVNTVWNSTCVLVF